MVHVILASAVLIAFLGKKRTRYALSAGFFILFLFAALRYMYGSDYINYLNAYNMIQLGIDPPFDEELCIFLNRISPSFYLLIAASSAAFVWTVHKLLIRNVSRKYAWIGLFVFVISPYLFLMNLSAIRQCMAMVMFICAVRQGINRKFLPFAAWVIFGSMFHKTAIILLPVYFILDQRVFRRRHTLLIMTAIMSILIFVDVRAISRIAIVAFNEVNFLSYMEKDNGNSLRATIMTGIFFLYVLFNMEKLEGKKLVYAKLSLVGYGLGLMAVYLSMFTRLQMYFDIFSIVTIPSIMETVNSEGKIRIYLRKPQKTLWRCVNKYALPMLMVVIYFLRYYSFFTTPMWEAFFTYQTIFSIM